MSKEEEYLEKNIKGILQQMVFSVLRDKPEYPVNY